VEFLQLKLELSVTKKPQIIRTMSDAYGLLQYLGQSNIHSMWTYIQQLRILMMAFLYLKSGTRGLKAIVDCECVIGVFFKAEKNNFACLFYFSSSVGWCEVSSRVAIVVFFTNGDTVSTGFQMNYTAYVDGTSHGRHVIASDVPSEIVNHPESGSYTNDEMSTFIYSPGFSFNPSVNVRSTINARGLEANDYVYGYSLDLSDTNIPWWNYEAE